MVLSGPVKIGWYGRAGLLTRIKRIKGLGVFGDFTADQNLPDFARYNLVYGSNGSGKTTLSRLFAALEAGVHPEFSGLEYGCDTQRGPIKNGQAFGRKVRVFNSTTLRRI
ncbi:AAA family ATPase [Paracoccus yeei]|uniref:AAA family ATPase n=1 Tax=Paracoccus yeei TaxID=147645 RepID=A0A5P2QWL1_9RHOB|nr:AAA family ATPase [Paracoccus yeei]